MTITNVHNQAAPISPSPKIKTPSCLRICLTFIKECCKNTGLLIKKNVSRIVSLFLKFVCFLCNILCQVLKVLCFCSFFQRLYERCTNCYSIISFFLKNIYLFSEIYIMLGNEATYELFVSISEKYTDLNKLIVLEVSLEEQIKEVVQKLKNNFLYLSEDMIAKLQNMILNILQQVKSHDSPIYQCIISPTCRLQKMLIDKEEFAIPKMFQLIKFEIQRFTSFQREGRWDDVMTEGELEKISSGKETSQVEGPSCEETTASLSFTDHGTT